MVYSARIDWSSFQDNTSQFDGTITAFLIFFLCYFRGEVSYIIGFARG